jgi:ABC-type antimicrobial peptide transport system permease subunit
MRILATPLQRRITGDLRPALLGLAAIAVAVGVAGAWGLTRYLTAMLYGVTPVDGITFSAAPLLLVAVAMAASLLPARKASRVDPVVALREE